MVVATTMMDNDNAKSNDGVIRKEVKATYERVGVFGFRATSLRGPHGIGDLGDQAIAFLDWLHGAGCTLWQVLPLVPPGRKSGEDGSPYSGQDANCGNTLLISLEELVKDGLLMENELPDPLDMEYVEFDTVANLKEPLIAKAAERLLQSPGELRRQYDEFKKNPDVSGKRSRFAVKTMLSASLIFLLGKTHLPLLLT
uniref:4-alpha-glucanotransferase n=1 Tax=Aegilops tauschii TaxID=37682 RepID=M8CLC4_AEGTA